MKRDLFSGASFGIVLALCVVFGVTVYVLCAHVRMLKGELSYYQALSVHQEGLAPPPMPAPEPEPPKQTAASEPFVCPPCVCVSTPTAPCAPTPPPPPPDTSEPVLQPSPRFSMERVTYADLPGWANDDFEGVSEALKASCEKVAQRPPVKIGASDSWKKACETVLNQKVTKPMFEKLFVPYQVKDGTSNMGTFTGYYVAELNGSFKKSKKYHVPIYAPPRDLLEINLSPFVKNCAPCNITGRISGNRFVPYLSRAEIAKGLHEDNVLIWVDDPVDAFLLHIQGSGVVTLPDGRRITVGFAQHNGHNFVGIGGLLLKEGYLPKGQGSMDHVRAWLKRNPEKAKELMHKNPRFIFFRILENVEGAHGVPLTSKRSLAVDPKYIPLGIPIWIDTRDGDKNPLQRLVIAQDVGAAIKGPIRGDFFWGYGEEAFQKAGKMKSAGAYYVFLPR